MKKQKDKNTKSEQNKTFPDNGNVFTKEDFLNALKKATRPSTKASPVKGKRRTSV